MAAVCPKNSDAVSELTVPLRNVSIRRW